MNNCLYVCVVVARHNGGGRGARKRWGGEGRNACYMNRGIRITPTDFLLIQLCQLSIRSQIRNWLTLWRTNDFTWEFTLFTDQRELSNRNFAVNSVRRNKQKGVSIAGVPSLSPQFPSPQSLLRRLVVARYLHYFLEVISPIKLKTACIATYVINFSNFKKHDKNISSWTWFRTEQSTDSFDILGPVYMCFFRFRLHAR